LLDETGPFSGDSATPDRSGTIDLTLAHDTPPLKESPTAARFKPP
jgi:hypothetical protein